MKVELSEKQLDDIVGALTVSIGEGYSEDTCILLIRYLEDGGYIKKEEWHKYQTRDEAYTEKRNRGVCK